MGMLVYQGTKPWLVSLIASKSSQVISFRDRFPRDYSDDAVLKLANNYLSDMVIIFKLRQISGFVAETSVTLVFSGWMNCNIFIL